MSIEDGDYSERLTDIALLQIRNLEPRILFFKSFSPGKPKKAAKPPKVDALVQLLSKALDQKIAGEISAKQFKRMRHRVNAAIRAAT